MTDFTLGSGNFARPYRSPWGSFPTRGMQISTGISSNTIKYGQVVGLDVNVSTLQDCIVPSSLTAGVVMSTTIVGIAAESPNAALASTTTTRTVIPVYEANPHVEFRAHTQGATLQSTQVGALKALVWDSTLNITKVDLSNSTAANVRVVVTELIDQIGDSGGAVAFRFIQDTPADSTSNLLAFYPR